jgi:hypothetical protein
MKRAAAGAENDDKEYGAVNAQKPIASAEPFACF